MQFPECLHGRFSIAAIQSTTVIDLYSPDEWPWSVLILKSGQVQANELFDCITHHPTIVQCEFFAP